MVTFGIEVKLLGFLKRWLCIYGKNFKYQKTLPIKELYEKLLCDLKCKETVREDPLNCANYKLCGNIWWKVFKHTQVEHSSYPLPSAFFIWTPNSNIDFKKSFRLFLKMAGSKSQEQETIIMCVIKYTL